MPLLTTTFWWEEVTIPFSHYNSYILIPLYMMVILHFHWQVTSLTFLPPSIWPSRSHSFIDEWLPLSMFDLYLSLLMPSCWYGTHSACWSLFITHSPFYWLPEVLGGPASTGRPLHHKYTFLRGATGDRWALEERQAFLTSKFILWWEGSQAIWGGGGLTLFCAFIWNSGVIILMESYRFSRHLTSFYWFCCYLWSSDSGCVSQWEQYRPLILEGGRELHIPLEFSLFPHFLDTSWVTSGSFTFLHHMCSAVIHHSILWPLVYYIVWKFTVTRCS